MQLVQLDVQGLGALIGLFLPILVALITKKYTSPIVKSATNVVVAVIGGVVAVVVQADGHITTWLVVNTIIVTLIASVTSYHGVLKSAKVYNLAPHAGLGKPTRRKAAPKPAA